MTSLSKTKTAHWETKRRCVLAACCRRYQFDDPWCLSADQRCTDWSLAVLSGFRSFFNSVSVQMFPRHTGVVSLLVSSTSSCGCTATPPADPHKSTDQHLTGDVKAIAHTCKLISELEVLIKFVWCSIHCGRSGRVWICKEFAEYLQLFVQGPSSIGNQ